MRVCKAILLLGPTGAGKTPLGELLQKNGLRRTKCHHFDFGAQLRKIGSVKTTPKSFANNDVDFIKHILNDNLLLDDKHFYIAEKILMSFINDNSVSKSDLIVLNGMPRHIGQAEKMDSILKIELVVYISCTARVVYERIRNNAGGDRTGRIDDTMIDIKNKLKIFRQETVPLLKHYHTLHIPLKTIKVNVRTSAEDVIKLLSSPLLRALV